MKTTKLFIDALPLIEPRPSGIGHTVVSLIRELASEKSFLDEYQIHLLVPFDKVDTMKRWNFPEQINITRLPFPSKVIGAFTRYGWSPYLDIFTGSGIYLFPNFRNWPLFRSKSLTYIHDVSFKVFPEFVQPQNLEMLERDVDTFLKRTQKVITVSYASKTELLENFKYLNSENVAVIPNGVNLEEFKPSAGKEIDSVRLKYQLPEKYFLFLSNIEPRKNVKTLLEGFRLLPQPILNKTGLMLVGGMGWLNEGILEDIDELRAQGLQIIRPSIYVPDEDLSALLSGAIALVHPAYHEGFGIAPLQALACGTPVVVSKTPAIQEVVGGQGLYLDEVENAELLSKLMQQVYNHEYTQNEREAFRNKAKEFTWKRSAEELVSVIKDVEKNA